MRPFEIPKWDVRGRISHFTDKGLVITFARFVVYHGDIKPTVSIDSSYIGLNFQRLMPRHEDLFTVWNRNNSAKQLGHVDKRGKYHFFGERKERITNEDFKLRFGDDRMYVQHLSRLTKRLNIVDNFFGREAPSIDDEPYWYRQWVGALGPLMRPITIRIE